MSRRPLRSRRTDYGTIILHWSLVCALSIALVSGLKIAAEAPDRSWINLLDPILPGTTVWAAHVEAGLALAGVAVAYAIYVWVARLTGRMRLGRMHLAALVGRGHGRWTALNVCLNWIFHLTMLSQLATGGLLYFDRGGSGVLALHWYGSWLIASFPVLHLATHWKLGRFAQLLRIFRPARLVSPPPPLDVADLLELLAQVVAAADRCGTAHGARARGGAVPRCVATARDGAAVQSVRGRRRGRHGRCGGAGDRRPEHGRDAAHPPYRPGRDAGAGR